MTGPRSRTRPAESAGGPPPTVPDTGRTHRAAARRSTG